MPARVGLARDAVALFALKVAVSGWVLSHGFSQVSDDDYARTVIAQTFAHGPRLDPSGTSWLPLPFWVTGAVMAMAGRSLSVARAVAVVLSAAAVVAPYAALRATGVRRPASFAATAVAMALPWNAWLGAATVPEGWTGALVAAALIAMPDDEARPWCAGALLAASLARYEAWPACAMFALFCATRPYVGHPRRREAALAGLSLAGVAGWMLWNLYAHGSPLHFLSRVRSFRHAIGAANAPLADKVLGYPLSLVAETPELAVLGAVGLGAMAASPSLRARWRWPVASAAAVLLFLVVGDVRDGAPTHHPARALGTLWWIGIACGVDALDTAWAWAQEPARRRAAFAMMSAAACVAAAWLIALPRRWADAPGTADGERRDAQITRGADMARRNVAAADVTPCSFEHFALLAAWGAPERATVHDRTGAPSTPACPALVER